MNTALRHIKGLLDRVLARPPWLYRQTAAAMSRASGVLRKPAAPQAIDDSRFRIPADLTRTPLLPKRIVLIGSCLMETWPQILSLKYPSVAIEYIVFNNASTLPPMDRQAAGAIGFQLLQIPLRSLLHEADYFQLRHSDLAGYERLFQSACRSLEMNLSAILDYNKQFGLLSFVLNFTVPQQNPMGRMLPRYSLNNYVFFVEELNRRLTEFVQSYTNAHVIDLDQIVSIFGRKYVQDDSLTITNHSSMLFYFEGPQDRYRLEPVGNFKDLYAPRAKDIVLAALDEAIAAYRSLMHHDSVKLVIFDLDDTLWRGVLAEADTIDADFVTEGWPISIVEALSHLWRRGILLAIASKNDEKTAERIWNELYGKRFGFDKFVVRKINWNPKAENIRDIIAAVNLQPENVLFVDDNPVERAAVKAAIPGIRVLDAPLATWRRVLLWSPELQPPVVTDEGTARTDMVKLQIQRDGDRARLDRDAFLATLDLKVHPFEIRSSADGKFARAHELLNKTNQFNTTGVRWTQAGLDALFTRGGFLLAADVSDKYTAYGVVAVAIVDANTIEQFVMSCRVFGLGVEARCMEFIKTAIARAGHATIKAKIVKTAKNALALDLYEKNGFTRDSDGLWSTGAAALETAGPLAPSKGLVRDAPFAPPVGGNGIAEEILFRASEFRGQPVNPESGAIHLDRPAGEAGHAVFGPYVRIAAGSYEATFLLEGKNGAGRAVTLDLDVHSGDLGVIRSAMRTVPNRGKVANISCRFDLKQDAGNLEFRIGARDFSGCAIEFHGILLKRFVPAGPYETEASAIAEGRALQM